MLRKRSIGGMDMVGSRSRSVAVADRSRAAGTFIRGVDMSGTTITTTTATAEAHESFLCNRQCRGTIMGTTMGISGSDHSSDSVSAGHHHLFGSIRGMLEADTVTDILPLAVST